MSDSAGPEPVASVEALRRLKEIETEWETKLTQARAEAVQRVAKAREAAEAAVAEARAEVDRAREALLTSARATAQAEAERIVTAGRAEADKVAGAARTASASLKAKLLDAVVGDFREAPGK